MKKYQVLIIDGEKKEAGRLSSLVESQGHKTFSVGSGEQGLSEIKVNDIALVVLDHENLADRDLEIIQEISEIAPDLQLIIHSRDKSFDSAIEALRRRVVDYLIKPCSDQQILGAIELALDLRTKQLRRAQYYEQMDYLWTRIKHLDKIEIDEFDRDGASGARFYAINQSTMVDLEKQVILYKDKTIPLSPADMSLLFVFLNNPRQILSFHDILLMKDSLDLPAEEAQSKLRPMIHRLRLRLSDIPGAEEWIESVRGIGYIFNV